MKPLAAITSAALGILYLGSGLLKLADPHAFSEVIRAFELAPDPLPALIACFIPPLELFCGLALLLRRWLYKGALALVAALSIAFIPVHLIASAMGLSCGCFGPLDPILAALPVAITLNSLAAISAIWLLFRSRHTPTRPAQHAP